MTGVTPNSVDDRRLVVRQSYPFKTSGMQECEGSRGLTQQESSRLITDDGTVIKFMTDGSVVVCMKLMNSVVMNNSLFI